MQLGPGPEGAGRVGGRAGPSATDKAAGRGEPVTMDLDLQDGDAGLRKRQVVITRGLRAQDKIADKRPRPGGVTQLPGTRGGLGPESRQFTAGLAARQENQA